MDSQDKSRLRNIGRIALEKAAKAGRDKQNTTMARRVMTVSKVNGDGTLDLNMGDATDFKPMQGIRMTTACSSAKAGDRVLVDTINHVSYVIGVLAF